MVFLYTVITIVCALVVLVQLYPVLLETWLDVLIGTIERWEEQRAYATQRGIQERIEQTEDRIGELREERVALQWFKVTLAILPVEEPAG